MSKLLNGCPYNIGTVVIICSDVTKNIFWVFFIKEAFTGGIKALLCTSAVEFKQFTDCIMCL